MDFIFSGKSKDLPYPKNRREARILCILQASRFRFFKINWKFMVIKLCISFLKRVPISLMQVLMLF